jgi:hypothetical protein
MRIFLNTHEIRIGQFADGCPLSAGSLRAEAADLLQLLTRLSENPQAPLFTFADSLLLLDILQTRK